MLVLQPAKYEDLQLVCERRKRLGLTAMFPRHGLFALGAFILMLEGCLAMDEASPLVAAAVPALFGVAAVAVGAAELGPGGRIPGRRRPRDDRGGGDYSKPSTAAREQSDHPRKEAFRRRSRAQR